MLGIPAGRGGEREERRTRPGAKERDLDRPRADRPRREDRPRRDAQRPKPQGGPTPGEASSTETPRPDAATDAVAASASENASTTPARPEKREDRDARRRDRGRRNKPQEKSKRELG